MGALHSAIQAAKEETIKAQVVEEVSRLNALVEIAHSKKREFELKLKLARGPNAPAKSMEITGGRTFMRHSQVYAATTDGLDQGITDALDDFFTAIDQTVPKNGGAGAKSSHKAAYEDAVRQRNCHNGSTLPAPDAGFKDYQGGPIPSSQFVTAVEDPSNMPRSDVISHVTDAANVVLMLKNDISVDGTTPSSITVTYSNAAGEDQSTTVVFSAYTESPFAVTIVAPLDVEQYYAVIKGSNPKPETVNAKSYANVKWIDYMTKRWDEVVSHYATLRDNDNEEKAAQHSAIAGTKRLIVSGISALVGTSKGSSNEIQDFFVMYVNGGFSRIDYCVYSYSIDAKSFGFQRTQSIMVTYAEAAILGHSDLTVDEHRFLMNQCVNRATADEVLAMNDATLTTKSMLADNYNWPKPAVPVPEDTRYFMGVPNPPIEVVKQAASEQDTQSGDGQK